MLEIGQGIYALVQNPVTLQHVCGYNYPYDIHEYTEDTIYRDVKGRSFVSYESYLVLLKYMTG